ncbi:MAG: hypothetical protein V8S58_15210 [Lachnospiraceae bacterium]
MELRLVYQNQKFRNTGTEEGILFGKTKSHRGAERKLGWGNRRINDWFGFAVHETTSFLTTNSFCFYYKSSAAGSGGVNSGMPNALVKTFICGGALGCRCMQV